MRGGVRDEGRGCEERGGGRGGVRGGVRGGESWRGWCAVASVVFDSWVISAEYRKWKSKVPLENCQRCGGG